MAIIKIDINKENNHFILSGNLETIYKDRRALLNFKDSFNQAIFQQKDIRIPFTKENKEEEIKKIHQLFKKFNLSEKHTTIVKKQLEEYISREGQFEEFSKKALLIRNNKYDKEDFKKFIKVIENSFPKRKLFWFQQLSAYHLAFTQNACNFSVPGAGKTSVVLAAYAYLKSLDDFDPKKVDKLLIIGPLSSFAPWEKEYEECFGKVPTSKRITGGLSRIEKHKYFLSPRNVEMTLISYQGVVNIINDLKTFLTINKTMVVLDEAHKIKNIEGGIISQSISEISNYCKSRVVLTGTPAPNGYEDLYNLYDFIWKGKNITGSKKHLQYLTKRKAVDSDGVKKMINSISPFFIRIKKKDLNLPDPSKPKTIIIKMGVLQQFLYDFIENKYLDELRKNPKEISIHNKFTNAKLIRLMQCATNPHLLKLPLENYLIDEGEIDKSQQKNLFIDDSLVFQKILNYNKIEIPPKFIEAEKIIQSLISSNQKVIVWSIFIDNIKDFSRYLWKKGVSNELLYGEIPVEKESLPKDIKTREKIIDNFHNENSTFKVIIANPFAVSESISLHKACHNAIYLDRSFNAAQFIQSKDRIHRVGLPEKTKTKYYYLLSKNSIDTSVDFRLNYKESRMLKIIESDSIPLIDENKDYETDRTDDLKRLIYDYVQRTRSK